MEGQANAPCFQASLVAIDFNAGDGLLRLPGLLMLVRDLETRSVNLCGWTGFTQRVSQRPLARATSMSPLLAWSTDNPPGASVV